uniref:Folate_rec domain-containing protein n=1 Tax=Macrostomum lignano TaxID=282301 RepID=A0A1I8H0J6_9PLAT
IDYSQCFSKWLANDGYNCSEFSSDRIDYSQCSSKWLANDGYNCSEFSSDRIDYESSSKWIINRSKRSQHPARNWSDEPTRHSVSSGCRRYSGETVYGISWMHTRIGAAAESATAVRLNRLA